MISPDCVTPYSFCNLVAGYKYRHVKKLARLRRRLCLLGKSKIRIGSHENILYLCYSTLEQFLDRKKNPIVYFGKLK